MSGFVLTSLPCRLASRLRQFAGGWRLLLLVWVYGLAPAHAWAEPGLTIGVFANADEPSVQRQFTPLGEYLSEHLKTPVSVKALSPTALERATKERRVDLLITNPLHFLQIRETYALTGALVTLIRDESGQEVGSLGGLIITRADRRDINTLDDLANRQIACPGRQFLGGCQAQLMELKERGIEVPDRLLAGLQDSNGVVRALVNEQADVGFIRSGDLERMVREGKLTLSSVKVIHQQNPPDFPYLTSTRLYPEWPVAALPHVDPHLVRQLVGALYSLNERHPVMVAAGLHAFTVPADYESVEKLARTLRLPPFAQPPEFTLSDELRKHQGWLAVIGLLCTLLLAGGWLLFRKHLTLRHTLSQAEQSEKDLELAANVFLHAQEGIMITDSTGLIVDVNRSFSRITGYNREEVIGRNPRMLSSGRQGKAFYEHMWKALESDGQWHGEIWNRRKSGEVYAEMLTITALYNPDGTLRHHLAVFSDVTTQKEHQRQLEFIAHYDVLTGLPNRTLLGDRLQQAISQAVRRDGVLAVVFLDLDGFKRINDQYGHDTGDHLLHILSKRVKEVLRNGDTLARMGGDEFVIVLNEIGDAADCDHVLTRVLEAAASPVVLNGQELQVSASLGVSLFPQDASDADLLLRHADHAMYQAKQAGKNRYQYFDAGQDDHARARREQVEQVITALSCGEFELYFQPKVDMRAGEVIGAEALLRWNHPDGTVHSPGTFLPAIEGHPVSANLGQWVMASALNQLSAWHQMGRLMPVSVNISAHHLQQKDFIAQLQHLLENHPDLPRHCLELEVLETSALEDMDWVADVIQSCAALGVGFALDDFGTGYSSLTYLKRLPAQVLKIDQSFVRDMLHDAEDLTIVEGVISLAQAFGRTVIAEGVETVDHGEMLLRLGCDLAQGYGIARPMPASAFTEWMAVWQPPSNWTSMRGLVPNRRDLPLVLAEVEHRDWAERIRRLANGLPGTPPQMSSSACHFGRTLATLQASGLVGDSAMWRVLLTEHDAVHEAGHRVLEAFDSGDALTLHEAIRSLDNASDQLIHSLRQIGLRRPMERTSY